MMVPAYEKLAVDREPYLRRARECAELTIPTSLLPDGWTAYTDLPTPYQSIGAQGLASLASKLLLALFPPSQPFFRLVVPEDVIAKSGLQDDDRADMEEDLAFVEKSVLQELESSAYRPYIHDALKQLLLAGNCLLYLPKEGGARLYKLDTYCIRRDFSGKPLEIIIKQKIHAGQATPEQMEILGLRGEDSNIGDIDLYTTIKWDEKKKVYTQKQMLRDIELPDSVTSYKESESPWLALRLEPITGQSYGYGYFSQLLGDLKTLEGLMMALVDGAAAAAQIRWLVDPTGVTKVRSLEEAPNGGFVSGREGEVTPITLGNKAYDLRVVQDAVGDITQRLSRACLLNASVQRQAERVTAEEIRLMAQELESVLAGTYSLLSVEFQLPLVELIMKKLERAGVIAKLPKDFVKPTVVTGLDALGRGADLSRLDAFVQGVLTSFGPDILNQFIDVGNYMSRRAAALGLQAKGLIKDPEVVEQERMQMQAASLANRVAPDVVRGMSQTPME